jgi:hypothetical protein
MKGNSLQTYIFEEISKNFRTRSEMIEDLMKLFNVKNDAIYRRLRCETMLTPDEMSTLAHYIAR